MATDPGYTALKETAGLINLTGRGKIEVTGSDRIQFLHNILTQDIKNLKTGQNTYAALLSAPGKVLADMNVFVFEDKLVLDTESGVEKKLLGLLDKFIITEDVTLKDVTTRTAHLALEGPQARPFPGKELLSFPMLRGMTGKTAFHCLFPDAACKPDAVQVDAQTLETARIEWGWLRYGIDMDESVSLPETGLDAIAASETKGCYPGQEVVARTNTYKGWQKKLVRLILEGKSLPKSGERILSADGKDIGWITSACFSPERGKNIALAYAAKGFFEAEGVQVFAGLKSEGSRAYIQALSF